MLLKIFTTSMKKEDLIYTSLISESNHQLLDFLQEFCIGFFIKVLYTNFIQILYKIKLSIF